jgi:DMSO/TMAO reductase YedYZ molybdopterin-dependent catalytic subunit
MHADRVNVMFEGRQPEGTGPANRHGMPTLPVGQRQVANWPVLDLGDSPHISLDEWRLEVGGQCENPFTLAWSQFLELPQVEDTSDFHCVTTWSRMDNHWTGVRFRTIAELAVPSSDTTHVLCTGYDHMPGTRIPYTTNLPLARAIEDDVLLVHAWEDRRRRRNTAACRMITPTLCLEGHEVDPEDRFLAGDRPDLGGQDTRTLRTRATIGMLEVLRS